MRILLKHVNKVVTPYGTYYYHRKTGTRLKSEYGTQAFIDEVNDLNRSLVNIQQQAARGTLGALMTAYKSSPEFMGLAPRTREDYQHVMNWLQPLKDMALLLISPPFIIEMRDKAFIQRKRSFANYVVTFLKLLFNWSIPRGYMSANPVLAVPKIKRDRDARTVNRPWLKHELKTVLTLAPQPIRVAVALGAFAALREGDALRMQLNAYNGKELRVTHQKTGASLVIPALPELKAILDAERESAKQRKKPSTLFVVSRSGKQFTEDGFRASLFKFIRKLHEAGKVGHGLTFHGLRHTAATELANAGCDTRDIMSVTGHKSEGMVAKYTARADQERRAKGAILKMKKGRTEN